MAGMTRDPLHSFIREGAAIGLLRAVSVLAMLAFVACMSRWLTAQDFGILALLVSLATLAAGFGSFGQAEMIIRDVAARRADGEEAAHVAVPNEVVALVMWVSAALGTATAAYLSIAGYAFGVCVAAILMTVGLSLMSALAGAARMVGLFILAMAPREIGWRCIAIAGVGTAVSAGMRPGIETVSMIVAGAVAICAVWPFSRLQLKWSALVRPSPRAMERNYVVASSTIAVSMLALVAMNTLDVIVVGALISPEAAAAYFPANRLALLASFASLPVQMVVEQRFAAEFAAGDRTAMQRTANQATSIHFALCLLLGLIVVGGFPLYANLFPTADQLSLKLLAILVGGRILSSLLGMSGSILVMSGHQDAFARVTIAAAIVAAVLLLLAASAGNLVAIAWAIAGVELVRKAVLAILANNLTGVRPFGRLRH